MAKNVIILKSKSDGSSEESYISILSGAGYNVKAIPPVDFDFCNLEELANRLLDPHSYSGLILCSPRCVKAILLASKISKADLCPWSMLPTFVVGETTDQEAVTIGLTTKGKECGNAARLTEFILEGKHRKSLLYPKGSLTAETMENALRTGGVDVEPLEVYRTIPHLNLDVEVQTIEQNLPAKLVFFSPSGVDSVLPLLVKHEIQFEMIEFYAIGGATEKALLSRGLTVKGTSEKPTPKALLTCINKTSQ